MSKRHRQLNEDIAKATQAAVKAPNVKKKKPNEDQKTDEEQYHDRMMKHAALLVEASEKAIEDARSNDKAVQDQLEWLLKASGKQAHAARTEPTNLRAKIHDLKRELEQKNERVKTLEGQFKAAMESRATLQQINTDQINHVENAKKAVTKAKEGQAKADALLEPYKSRLNEMNSFFERFHSNVVLRVDGISQAIDAYNTGDSRNAFQRNRSLESDINNLNDAMKRGWDRIKDEYNELTVAGTFPDVDQPSRDELASILGDDFDAEDVETAVNEFEGTDDGAGEHSPYSEALREAMAEGEAQENAIEISSKGSDDEEEDDEAAEAPARDDERGTGSGLFVSEDPPDFGGFPDPPVVYPPGFNGLDPRHYRKPDEPAEQRGFSGFGDDEADGEEAEDEEEILARRSALFGVPNTRSLKKST